MEALLLIPLAIVIVAVKKTVKAIKDNAGCMSEVFGGGK